jgi:hypothetical protein
MSQEYIYGLFSLCYGYFPIIVLYVSSMQTAEQFHVLLMSQEHSQ